MREMLEVCRDHSPTFFVSVRRPSMSGERALGPTFPVAVPRVPQHRLHVITDQRLTA